MTGPGLRVREHHRAGKGGSGSRLLRYSAEGDHLTWYSHEILGAAQHVLPIGDVEVRCVASDACASLSLLTFSSCCLLLLPFLLLLPAPPPFVVGRCFRCVIHVDIIVFLHLTPAVTNQRLRRPPEEESLFYPLSRPDITYAIPCRVCVGNLDNSKTLRFKRRGDSYICKLRNVAPSRPL